MKKVALAALLTLPVLYGLMWASLAANLPDESYRVTAGFPAPQLISVPAWERKLDVTGTEFKIGLITDTHVDSVRSDKTAPKESTESRVVEQQYLDMMDDFVVNMKEFDPQFLVHLGDVIEGTNTPAVVGEFEVGIVAEKLRGADKPLYWVIGNHDLRSIPRKAFTQQLGIDYVNHYFDEGPHRFIILDSNYREGGIPSSPATSDYIPGYIPETTFAWLREVLDTQQHTYIFMHHSPVAFELTRKKSIANIDDFTELLSERNVQAVFSGHVERRFMREIGGVTYYTLPGIKKNPLYPGAFYQMTLRAASPDVEMFARNPESGELAQMPFFEEGKMIGDIIVRQEAEEKMRAEEEESISPETASEQLQ